MDCLISFRNLNMEQSEIAIYGLIVTIILAVIGWLLSVFLQQKNVRDEHKAKINYEIYRELVTIHKDLQDSIGEFGASAHAPLVLMSTELMPLELQRKFGKLSLLPPTTEEECLHKGIQKYTNWVYNELYAKHTLYKDAYIRFLYLTEDWTAPLLKTKQAQNVLYEEIDEMNKKISSHLDVLQNYPREHGADWRNWDKEDVNRHSEAVSELTMTIRCYVSDFMVIAHNELLTPFYGHMRTTRKTIDPTLKVLTINGLATNIEDDPNILAKFNDL